MKEINQSVLHEHSKLGSNSLLQDKASTEEELLKIGSKCNTIGTMKEKKNPDKMGEGMELENLKNETTCIENFTERKLKSYEIRKKIF